MLKKQDFFIRVVVVGLLTIAFLPVRSLAQETTASISGMVTDPSGAVIPEAAVKATNIATGAQRTTTTTQAGVFFFVRLPIGDYKLSVEKNGFKKQEQTGIHLDVNDKLNLNITLQVGAVTQSVTVTGAAPLLSTQTAEVSNLVGAEQTQALPLNGRAFNQLVDLVPGVAPDNGRVGGGVGLDSDTAASVNGAQSNQNIFLVDGVYNEDNGSAANLLVTPSIDSLDEFKILRNNYSAEFGGGSGAIVNIVTKSGTQQFHGDLYEFVRNDKLDAADFFLNATGSQKSELRLNDFGGTIGGPFWLGNYNKDKTKDFFFASVEVHREVRGNVITDNVPSARQRQGLLDPTCASTPAPCTPQAADPFEVPINGEANVDPGMIDPNGAAILERYPLPNANYDVNGFNFITSSPTVTNVDQETYRWDHYVSEKATVMVRWMQMKQALNGINNQLWGDDSFPSVNSDWKWLGSNATLHFTYSLTPTIVNDFQFGYSHNYISFVTGKTSDETLASRAGFTYTELFPETSGSFPSMFGVENFGAISHTAPFFNKTNNFQFKDDVAMTFGKHNLKVGFSGLAFAKLEPANGGDDETAGTVEFNSFQDLLLGNILNYSEQQSQNFVPDRARNAALYVQDDYKAASNLTLNLGLRWQYLGQINSAKNNIANFLPSRYDPAACPASAFNADGLVDPTMCNTLNGIITPQNFSSRSLLQNHRLDFEPRFGIAWLPRGFNNKLVIRTGFGMFHGRDAISQTSSLGQQPPFDLYPTLNNLTFSQLAPGQLAPFDPNLPQPPVTISALDPVYNNPLSYQYSFGVQYQLPSRTTLEVDYVGSHQIHLGQNRDINQIPAQYQAGVFDGSIAIPDAVRPYRGFSVINMNERVGTSSYNSLQVFLNHHMQKGVQFQIAYTYSRNISNTINQDTEGRNTPVQDAYNPQLDRGLTNQDTPHSLVLNYIWDLPFYKSETGWQGKMLGGWEVVGISTFRSGTPFTACEDQDIAGILDGNICQRPNLVGNAILPEGQRTLGQYFNTSAFVLQTPGTFGNAARNNLRGPGIIDSDFSLFKNTKVPWFGRGSGGEGANLQFRAEFFNVFNHTQFNSVDNTFVVQTDANGNPIVGSTADPTSSFGTVNGARAPREIQLALKLIF
jgi:Carboxypeptidase regulatory-like domain/TonB-dependent Receptor Plug Domain